MSKKDSLGKDIGKKRHVTNFYIETLILVVVLIAVILVLARVFAFSSAVSSRAEKLTRAVHLAENAAEAVAASDSLDTLGGLLGEGGNVQVSREEALLRAGYDEEMRPLSGGTYRVEVNWVPEAAPGGSFVESTVSVYWMEEEEPLYALETAVYLDGVFLEGGAG